MPLPKPLILRKNGGTPFDTKENMSGVSEILIREGKFVDGIQLFFRDGTSSEYRGGEGGESNVFTVPFEDKISLVTVWSGVVVDAIQFHTIKGLSSPKFGGSGGIAKEFLAPNSRSE